MYSKQEPDRTKRQIKHFSHKQHPLIFQEDHKADGGVQINCYGCSQPIWGPSYSCIWCYIFFHKSCVELPLKMTHPLHPQHPITLSLTPPYGSTNCSCSVCGNACEKYFYTCSSPSCFFSLDVICLSTVDKIRETVKHKSHPHPLIHLPRPASFFCFGCGSEHRGASYLCTTCGFWVNEKCASLPSTLRCKDHRHALTLSFSFPDEYYHFKPDCDICNEKLNRQYWVYYCGGCRYFVRVNCATSKVEGLRVCETEMEGKVDVGSNVMKLPLADDPIAIFMKNISLQGKYKKAAEINHISHDHPLILVDNQISDESNSDSKLPLLNEVTHNGNCNGCTKPISAPFYHCAQCKFFLHECCAEIHNELRHPCHPDHPLLLISQQTTNSRSHTFGRHPEHSFLQIAKPTMSSHPHTCQGCAKYCNALMFGCSACEFYLDIKCASLPHIIKHEAHKRLLRLKKITNGICTACYGNFSGFVFVCETCNLKICFLCALLPGKVSHRYDPHPFLLTYSPIENHPDVDEYYCEICEREINPKLWFYHCVECDQSLHTACIHPHLGMYI